MAKPLRDELNDKLAEFFLIAIGFAVLSLPYVVGGTAGGIIAIIIVLGVVILYISAAIFGGKQIDEPKSSVPFKPNPNYKYEQRKQPKNFTHKSTLEWKECPKCNHKVNKVAKTCPYCEHEFKRESKWIL